MEHKLSVICSKDALRLMGMRAKPKATLPTAAELRLLQVLWDRGESTVEEIVNAHPPRRRPNYKTTHTLLRIMEQKGFVTHDVNGRAFIFRALVTRKTADQDSVRALLSRNFGGSAAGLFVNLLESASLTATQIDELEDLLREYRKNHRSDPPER